MIVAPRAQVGSLGNARVVPDRDLGQVVDPNVFADPTVAPSRSRQGNLIRTCGLITAPVLTAAPKRRKSQR